MHDTSNMNQWFILIIRSKNLNKVLRNVLNPVYLKEGILYGKEGIVRTIWMTYIMLPLHDKINPISRICSYPLFLSSMWTVWKHDLYAPLKDFVIILIFCVPYTPFLDFRKSGYVSFRKVWEQTNFETLCVDHCWQTTYNLGTTKVDQNENMFVEKITLAGCFVSFSRTALHFFPILCSVYRMTWFQMILVLHLLEFWLNIII